MRSIRGWGAWPRRSSRLLSLLLIALFVGSGVVQAEHTEPLPFVKRMTPASGSLTIDTVHIQPSDAALINIKTRLLEMLAEIGISPAQSGTPIQLQLGTVPLPEIRSRYRSKIEDQAYRLVASHDGICITGRTPQALYYGAATLRWLINDQRRLAHAEIVDWPDLAVRCVMVDPARANENAAYYTRLIRFCARYKISRLHVHLTDNETSALYHEDYPEIMHPHAWRSDDLQKLVDLAQQHYIDIVPEIESLGHARCFDRHSRGRDFLHQTSAEKPWKAWAGTPLEGYTNVLCPASDDALQYLDDMYTRTVDIFPFPELHLGFDEVDKSDCARCKAAFGELHHSRWFLKHLKHCADSARARGRTVSIWGDMLLHYRDIVEQIPRKGTIIYDWHYNPSVSDKSVKFFDGLGFDVIACPALMCYSHMILPGSYNYDNIHRFAEIAVANDLMGIDTTVWTPVRYMSDVLWPGLAYAATHSWSVSNWNEDAFYSSFARDFFGLPATDEFADVWRELYRVDWRLTDFRLACWHDDASLAQAAAALKAADAVSGDDPGVESVRKARKFLATMATLQNRWRKLGAKVTRNAEVWRVIEVSAEARAFTMKHLLESEAIRQGRDWDVARVRALDEACRSILREIETGWDRTRYADDPYKRDLCNQRQHLLDTFWRMSEFHQQILSGEGPGTGN